MRLPHPDVSLWDLQRRFYTYQNNKAESILIRLYLLSKV